MIFESKKILKTGKKLSEDFCQLGGGKSGEWERRKTGKPAPET